MNNVSETQKYPIAMRALHWLMALTILGMIGSGWYMAELPDDAANKYDLYPLHKSFGSLVLMLLALRIVVRVFSTVPQMPSVLAAWEKLAAHAGHIGLYALMFAVPASGYLMSSAFPYGEGVDFFWTKLPDVLEKSKEVSGFWHSLHAPFAYALLGLVTIHVAAVVKHKLVDAKEADVLKRML